MEQISDLMASLKDASFFLFLVLPYLVISVLAKSYKTDTKKTLAKITMVAVVIFACMRGLVAIWQLALIPFSVEELLNNVILMTASKLVYDFVKREGIQKTNKLYINGYIWSLGELGLTNYPEIRTSFELPGVGRVGVESYFEHIKELNIPGIKIIKI